MVVCFHPQTLLKHNMRPTNPGQVAFMSNGCFVQLYRANPLMLTSAAQYIPLPRPLATMLLSKVIHSLVIADVRFPTFESREKFCQLKRDGEDDILEISFKLGSIELKKQRQELKQVSKTLKTIGLIPLKVVNDFVTSHYGGGVPFHGLGRLATNINGKLKHSKRVYVADSATWRALPGKPLALTIMANARRIGNYVLKKYNSEFL